VGELAGDDPWLSPILQPLLANLASTPQELARLTKQVVDIVRGRRSAGG